MKKLFFALAIPLLFTACQPEEDYQISTVETVVSNVSFSDTISLGDTVNIELDYKIFNDCGIYVGTEAVRNVNNILFQSFVKYSYEGNSACPENITTGEETLSFKPEAKGTYYLLFRKENSNGYDTDTLVVE